MKFQYSSSLPAKPLKAVHRAHHSDISFFSLFNKWEFSTRKTSDCSDFSLLKFFFLFL